jgi:hypothetical protein
MDTTKVVITGKFRAVNTYVKKKEYFKQLFWDPNELEAENNFERLQCSILIQMKKIHQPYLHSFTIFMYPPPLTSTCHLG